MNLFFSTKDFNLNLNINHFWMQNGERLFRIVKRICLLENIFSAMRKATLEFML